VILIHQRHRRTDGRTDGQTDRQTDGRNAISIPRYALVHRAVKTVIFKRWKKDKVATFIYRHLHLMTSSGLQFEVAYWPAMTLGGTAQLAAAHCPNERTLDPSGFLSTITCFMFLLALSTLIPYVRMTSFVARVHVPNFAPHTARNLYNGYAADRSGQSVYYESMRLFICWDN